MSLYIKSFKDRPEEELLEKITHLSNELGLWKDVKEELTSFMAEEGDTHNLLELYLRDKDLVSAFKIASQHINDNAALYPEGYEINKRTLYLCFL